MTSLKFRFNRKKAMEIAVGGDFDAFGILERQTIIKYGLLPSHYVIDVGCGSGRLTKALAEYLKGGRYLGIDVVPELIEYARTNFGRSGWRFELTEGSNIPEDDHQADMVCFFSVFTHLPHEHSYLYLREAKRVLRPSGKIVFSFLEFAIPSHWAAFEDSLKAIGGERTLCQFMSRDGIAAWASHVGLRVDVIEDGDKPTVPLPHPIVLSHGTKMEGMGFLGQSICVLSVPNS